MGINFEDDDNPDWDFSGDFFEANSEKQAKPADTTTRISDLESEYESIAEQVKSVVPDGITSVEIVALRLDDTTIGYRFVTNVGKFDITKIKARELGINGIKVEKMLRLQRKNGLLLSKGEISNHQVIPDISDCEEDCQKLFNALFE